MVPRPEASALTGNMLQMWIFFLKLTSYLLNLKPSDWAPAIGVLPNPSGESAC